MSRRASKIRLPETWAHQRKLKRKATMDDLARQTESSIMTPLAATSRSSSESIASSSAHRDKRQKRSREEPNFSWVSVDLNLYCHPNVLPASRPLSSHSSSEPLRTPSTLWCIKRLPASDLRSSMLPSTTISIRWNIILRPFASKTSHLAPFRCWFNGCTPRLSRFANFHNVLVSETTKIVLKRTCFPHRCSLNQNVRRIWHWLVSGFWPRGLESLDCKTPWSITSTQSRDIIEKSLYQHTTTSTEVPLPIVFSASTHLTQQSTTLMLRLWGTGRPRFLGHYWLYWRYNFWQSVIQEKAVHISVRVQLTCIWSVLS